MFKIEKSKSMFLKAGKRLLKDGKFLGYFFAVREIFFSKIVIKLEYIRTCVLFSASFSTYFASTS